MVCAMAPPPQASSTESSLASDLGASVVRLRRRLVSERDPGNPLTMNAMAVLGALAREGDLRVGELASREGVRPPSMTRTLNGLERHGYITRAPSSTDGRQVVVSLTERGRTTLRADRRRRDEWLARQLQALGPAERDVLMKAVPILHRISSTD